MECVACGRPAKKTPSGVVGLTAACPPFGHAIDKPFSKQI